MGKYVLMVKRSHKEELEQVTTLSSWVESNFDWSTLTLVQRTAYDLQQQVPLQAKPGKKKEEVISGY
jgi:hypothetical protein